MKSPIVGRLAAVLSAGLLAACGGGTTDTTGTTGGTGTNDVIPDGSSGAPDIEGIVNDSQVGDLFVARSQEMVDILQSFPTTPAALPTSGSATFSGAGIIIDGDIPNDVDTVAEALGYALFSTDATASIDFGTGDVSARQFDFRNVVDAPVSGEVNYSATIVSGTSGTTGTIPVVTGNVDGTTISIAGAGDPDGQRAGVVVLVDTDGSKNTTGFFDATGAGGTYDGRNLTGTFFAKED